MGYKTFDEEYKEAVRAAAEADMTEPRAKSARYDRQSQRIVVELRNGSTFLFPPELLQGLAGASTTDLAKVKVSPSGAGLYWPSLDADFSLPALLAGIFGTRAWQSRPGGRDGRLRSEVKAVGSRANGKTGAGARRTRRGTGRS